MCCVWGGIPSCVEPPCPGPPFLSGWKMCIHTENDDGKRQTDRDRGGRERERERRPPSSLLLAPSSLSLSLGASSRFPSPDKMCHWSEIREGWPMLHLWLDFNTVVSIKKSHATQKTEMLPYPRTWNHDGFTEGLMCEVDLVGFSL